MRVKMNKKNVSCVARTFLVLFFAAALLIRPAPVRAYRCPSPGVKNGLVQVKIHQIALDPNSSQPVVVLTDPLEERSLLIWIGSFEANAIHSEMQGIKHPRPLTHDLLEKFIREANVKIQCVIITRVEEMVYIASIHMEIEGSPIEMDARPSDSMVIALKFKAPLFVSEDVFKTMSVPMQTQTKIEEEYGFTAQDLTPSLSQAFSYESSRGVLISDVRKGSPAEKDGFKRGDIIMEIAGQPIENVTSLRKTWVEFVNPVPARIFRKAQSIALTINPG